jgi:hypothetical protein
MFPLRDDVPSSRFPIVTLAIIALNVASFLVEVWLGPKLQDFTAHVGRFAFGALLGTVIKPSFLNRRQHQEELLW